MAKQGISTGSSPNDGTGDSLLAGAVKVNENFDEVYGKLGDGTSLFVGIVDMTTIYRTIPLIIVLPIGVYIGDKFFIKSKEETYRKIVLYFLIFISVIGILRIINNI